MIDDQDIDFRVDDEYFWQDHCEMESEPDYESIEAEREKSLLDDALHHSITHIEQYDIDNCFEGLSPSYFEGNTIGELFDYAKGIKIKAMLLFVSEDTAISEVSEAVDSLKPFCTEECLNDGKLLFGAGDESTKDKAKYRALVSFEFPKSEFEEDIPF